MLGKGGRACLCQCEPSGRAPLSFSKPGEFHDFPNWNFMILFVNYVVSHVCQTTCEEINSASVKSWIKWSKRAGNTG